MIVDSTRVRAAPPARSLGSSGLWGRCHAALYDPFFRPAERAFLADWRQELLASAEGTTLELGAGTGLNLRHYPWWVEKLVLTEPEGPMARRLERRLGELGREATVLRAPAEALPFPDAAFDTVVSTFVLCNVADLQQAIREIVRVLRPGGQLLFLEHVRSESARLASWQDRLDGPWRRLACGCHCNRRTLEVLAASQLEVVRAERTTHDKWGPVLVKPLVVGRALKPGGGAR